MTPQNNSECVSCPIAKALKLAGFDFASDYCFHYEGYAPPTEIRPRIPAPNWSHIIKILPEKIIYKGVEYVLKSDWDWSYCSENNKSVLCIEQDFFIVSSIHDSRSDAAAKLLLLLKKHNLV